MVIHKKKPFKGWQGQVRLSETEAGLANAEPLIVTAAPVTMDTAIDNQFIIGQRSPYAILEGATSVSGSLIAPFEDEKFANLAGIMGDGPIVIPEVPLVLGIFPDGFGDGKNALIIFGVRFGTWSSGIAVDDVVEQSLDWTGEIPSWKRCESIGKKSIYKSIMEKGDVE